MESILCPISEELEQEKAKRASAVAKLVVLQRRQEELDERLSGVDELEQQLQDVNDEWMAALASKERTKQRLQREATENARLKKLNEKFQGALKDTKEEVVKLETALEESKNQIQITKKKLRVLTKQIPKATAQKQNPDDSLHVLKPDDEEETGRQLIKRRRLIRT
ncbi:hypothetical protein DXG01_004728 [Tephrocybe rancida]|nr:hypothetical protein DXG01_004728 [Tephrocybe rancida]